MSSNPLLRRLAERPLLCDGALGTLLYARGARAEAPFEALNVAQPRLVQQAHLDYIAAGADCIETNTFGANRYRLGPLADRVRDFNLRGARLAREARETAGRDVVVLGALGPLGRHLTPVGQLTPEDARAAFREQAAALLEGGVDALVLETFADPAELRLAAEALRDVTDLPLIGQLAFTDEAVTFTGLSPAAAVRELRDVGFAAFGANCGAGPAALSVVLEQMRSAAAGTPLATQPNAGLPGRVGDRVVYVSSPAYMAEWAAQMAAAGARLIGGCCGTTPEHVRAMRRALDTASESLAPTARPATTGASVACSSAADTQPTVMERKLLAREFVVSVELDPPRGLGVDKLLQGAKLLREHGVEIVDVNDGSLGRVRMAVLAAAAIVRDATGLDVNMHVTCRDRNLMGLQAELLGAHALGVRNILAMTGDPPRAGDYANATAVFDVDAVGLLRVLAGLNEGTDAGGNPIGVRAGFHVGAVVDPASPDPAREIERLHRKLEAGARWLQTQPVYELDVLDAFLARAAVPASVPIIVGVLPLHSHRHAEFLHNEVPGITIPDWVRARLREAGQHGLAVGIEMAQALVVNVRRRYAGAYVMPSFGRFEVAAEVVDAAEL
ncbi:MAG TPA: bifunctional homocysteine S-methyltransferase/methylenetetrahydrofolate reductase [Terriglobales bacterium]|nr:bifunctional homocysteine S-methyltransferase/methylenetetrahydrofolate reductase [Terriglobales bacterium]